MVDNKKISGMLTLGEAEWAGFPYIEAVSSFLPIVDELVVAFNVLCKKDGSREKLEKLSDKIRIVTSVFDLEKFGWVSHGISKSMGYQACKGDIVLMFDADDVLHEKDHEQLNRELFEFISSPNMPTGFWERYQIYKPDLYYVEHKHSGIYNKEVLGDRFDFILENGRGAPNFSRLNPGEDRSKKFGTTLFAYEHMWDTEWVLRCKVDRYGKMIDKLEGNPIKTLDEYYENYIKGLMVNLRNKGKTMNIEDHPKIMQKRLSEINETHFGYNFFGRKQFI